MIKIDKKYLTKIIKEESAKASNQINENAAQAAKAAWTALPPEVKAMIVQYVVEKGPKTLDAAFEKIKDSWKNRGSSGGSSLSDDDLMDYSTPCPQGWKDADCLQNKINTILKGALEGLGERYGLEADQEQKLISDFMYDIEEPLLDLTLATVGGEEDTQGEGDELDMTARFDKKGARNFGTHDLMGDTDADLMEKKEMKISKTQLAKIIQEEIAKILGEEDLNEEDKDWIQGAEKDIERRGTEGVCTGDKFGSESCPPGSKRYNLAKTFRKMAKDRKDK